eukprot:364063-Chlamydomonas_euryale.AAC.5
MSHILSGWLSGCMCACVSSCNVDAWKCKPRAYTPTCNPTVHARHPAPMPRIAAVHVSPPYTHAEAHNINTWALHISCPVSWLMGAEAAWARTECVHTKCARAHQRVYSYGVKATNPVLLSFLLPRQTCSPSSFLLHSFLPAVCLSSPPQNNTTSMQRPSPSSCPPPQACTRAHLRARRRRASTTGCWLLQVWEVSGHRLLGAGCCRCGRCQGIDYWVLAVAGVGGVRASTTGCWLLQVWEVSGHLRGM